jgi:hypothetical protein
MVVATALHPARRRPPPFWRPRCGWWPRTPCSLQSASGSSPRCWPPSRRKRSTPSTATRPRRPSTARPSAGSCRLRHLRRGHGQDRELPPPLGSARGRGCPLPAGWARNGKPPAPPLIGHIVFARLTGSCVSRWLEGRTEAGRQSGVGGPGAGHHGFGRSPRAQPDPAAGRTGPGRVLAGR